MVATGVLGAGTRLPPIRQLAKDLGLATGTVARAYRELESDGVIDSRGRHGTHVTGTPPRGDRAGAARDLAEAALSFAVQARQLGADPARALQAARRALAAVDG
jgi:DNA-binding transcriptional regulator YhcF (GntR family)